MFNNRVCATYGKGYGCEDRSCRAAVTMENAPAPETISRGTGPGVPGVARGGGGGRGVSERRKGGHRGLVGAGVPGQGRPATRHRGEGAGVEVGRRPAALRRCSAIPRSPPGAFYNCPTGWTCEIVNSQKLGPTGCRTATRTSRTGTGPGCGDQCGLRRAASRCFLLLVADSVDGPFQAGATGRAAVQRAGRAAATLADPKKPDPIGSARCLRRSPLAFPRFP